jgi:hypothetical protein
VGKAEKVTGNLRFTIGDLRLVIGDWRLAIGDWRLANEGFALGASAQDLRGWVGEFEQELRAHDL